MSTDFRDSVAPLQAWLDQANSVSQEEARQLKAQADASDRQAFERLVQAATRYAVQMAHAHHRNTDFDLDECVSVAGLCAVECATKFNPDRGSLLSFVHCRMRTLLSDAQRKAIRGAQPTEGEYNFDLVPDEANDRLARAALVQTAIEKLPTNLRRVIELHVFECLNSAEIARREGLDVKHVQQLLRNAKSLLRDDLADLI